MKKLIAVLLVVATVGWVAERRVGKTPAAPEYRYDNETAQVVQSPTPTPVPIGFPTTLTIERLGISAEVEQVGMEPSGRMGVPKSAYTVGWWKLGVKPGEKGSAVLAGHLDTPEGTAGVFYELESLVVGDELVVTDSLGLGQVFVVKDTATYPDVTFPIDLVFARTDGAYLNLITCAGTWDASNRNYEGRYVVFAEKME